MYTDLAAVDVVRGDDDDYYVVVGGCGLNLGSNGDSNFDCLLCGHGYG